MLGVGGTALTDLRRELLGRDQLALTAFRSVTINAALSMSNLTIKARSEHQSSPHVTKVARNTPTGTLILGPELMASRR